MKREARFPNPGKEPARDGRLVAPNEGGGTNYRSPSFDPASGLFIVSAQDGYGIYFFKPEHGDYGWAGADYGVYGKGILRAIDYQTGQIKWEHDLDGGGRAGMLTTASGLLFTGDAAGSAFALRTATARRCGTRRLGVLATRRSSMSSTAANTSSWPAAACSTRGRCRKR